MSTTLSDPTINGGSGVQRTNGGKLLVVSGDSTLALDPGATFIRSGSPQTASIAAAASTSNKTNVTIQLKDGNGDNLTTCRVVLVYLSDAATGAGLTATTASGAVGAGSSGTDLTAIVAKMLLLVQTDATGKYVLSITDSAKTGFYVCVALPDGTVIASAQLVTGNYG